MTERECNVNKELHRIKNTGIIAHAWVCVCMDEEAAGGGEVEASSGAQTGHEKRKPCKIVTTRTDTGGVLACSKCRSMQELVVRKPEGVGTFHL